MLNAPKILYHTIKGLLAIYLIYCLLFIVQHFIIPTIGEIDISVTANNKVLTNQDVTITPQKPPSRYYVLLYEENKKNDWIYFINQTYDKRRQTIADTFLPEDTMKYILFEGSKKNSSFTFQIQPKYPINYVVRKQSCFHVIYIIPYKIYPFPDFYYCSHSVIYIDTLK
jgi:hypothetical protein